MKYTDTDPPSTVTPVSLKLIEFEDRARREKARKKLPKDPKEPFISISDRAMIGEILPRIVESLFLYVLVLIILWNTFLAKC